jgi:hypothetical protein
MWFRCVFSAVIFSLIALVGVAGVNAAAMRTPDRAELELLVHEQALGIFTPSICGAGLKEKPHCPLCHGLPGVPMSEHHAIVLAMVPHSAWVRLKALTRAAQGRNINHSPRAPPAVI